MFMKIDIDMLKAERYAVNFVKSKYNTNLHIEEKNQTSVGEGIFKIKLFGFLMNDKEKTTFPFLVVVKMNRRFILLKKFQIFVYINNPTEEQKEDFKKNIFA